jgi:hypothetical protein
LIAILREVLATPVAVHSRRQASTLAMMSGEKRPAPDAFGSSSQLVVKRQKSDSNLNANAVAVRGAQNGTLVQAVCDFFTFVIPFSVDSLECPKLPTS